ncbi:MAG: radical SAM protein [Desulfobacteraceae bacterium]|nr:radical SAM protein [Desulfobacteraceae bacterium]
MRCTICASNILCNNRYERNTPLDVVESILRLAERGVKDIVFWDDALLMDAEEYALPTLEALAQAGAPVRLSISNGLHIAKITPKVARAMKKGGIQKVFLSIETISKTRMRSFSQKTIMDQFQLAVEALLSAGYRSEQIRAYVLFGLPGQTVEEALNTKEFIRSFGVNYKISSFSPVPGTVEFKRAVKEGIIEKDSDPVLQNNKLTAINFFKKNKNKREKFKELFDLKNSIF